MKNGLKFAPKLESSLDLNRENIDRVWAKHFIIKYVSFFEPTELTKSRRLLEN